MGYSYKRKRISSIDGLNLEEDKIRRKLRKLEQEWTEILDPQQLAIGFLTNFVTKKITGKKSSSEKKTLLSKSTDHKANLFQEKTTKKKPFWKKAIKVTAISLVAVVVIKKILKTRQSKLVTPPSTSDNLSR